MHLGGEARRNYSGREAVVYFRKAYDSYVELHSKAEAAAWVGYVLWETERYTESVRYLTDAIALKSDNPHHYYWRTAPYLSLGQVDQAITDYRKAIELADWSKPLEAEIRLALASLYCEMAQPELAQAEIERVRSLVPDVSVPASCHNLPSRGDP